MKKVWRKCQASELLQLGVFPFRFFENRNIGIGIFPQGEEILIGGPRLEPVSRHGIGRAQLQMRQRADRIPGYDPSVVENLLELGGRYIDLCAIILLLEAGVGFWGFLLHAEGNLRGPSVHPFDNFIYGAPPWLRCCSPI
jgi:hypothetical protein